MKPTSIGPDIAKHIFQVHGANAGGPFGSTKASWRDRRLPQNR